MDVGRFGLLYDMTSDELKSKIDNGDTVTIKDTVIKGNTEIIHGSNTISNISFDNCLFRDDVVIKINGNCYINFSNCRIAGNIYIRHSSINNLDFYCIICKGFTICDSKIENSRFKYIECIDDIRLYNTTIYESFILGVQSYGIDINSSLFFRDTIYDVSGHYIHLNVILNTAFNCCNITRASIGRVYIYNCEFNYTSIGECGYTTITTYNSNIKDMIRQLCPQEGSFIGYKSVDLYQPIGEYHWIKGIAVLEIPADAERVNGFNNKCRCSKAKVLRLEDIEGNVLTSYTAYSPVQTDNMIKYIPGEMVYPDSFDDNVFVECSHGIHFFMNKEKAINY